MLTVNFESHPRAHTNVTWLKDEVLINSRDITTFYMTAPNITTEFHFAQITRRDQGTYHVIVENRVGIIPTELGIAEAIFSISVKGRM